jgi:hypothetical protein
MSFGCASDVPVRGVIVPGLAHLEDSYATQVCAKAQTRAPVQGHRH